MNKKTTPTKTAAPAADNYLAQGIKGERKKSGLGTFLDRLPAPFISLNSVIAAVAEANEGSFREAARSLRILEREDDFPSWYRWADAKSKGKLDTEIGAAWGPKLLQHAEMFGEPVEFPHDDYRDCGYDLSAMPEGSVHHFLAVGPTLGFQRSDIGPFLTSHGIKGFDLGPAVERKDAEPVDNVSVHRTANPRVNLLRPIIENAQGLAGGSFEAAAVWAQLERLASQPDRPAPLVGVNAGGIQYRDGSKSRTLTIGALRDRLRRAAARDSAR